MDSDLVLLLASGDGIPPTNAKLSSEAEPAELEANAMVLFVAM